MSASGSTERPAAEKMPTQASFLTPDLPSCAALAAFGIELGHCGGGASESVRQSGVQALRAVRERLVQASESMRSGRAGTGGNPVMLSVLSETVGAWRKAPLGTLEALSRTVAELASLLDRAVLGQLPSAQVSSLRNFLLELSRRARDALAVARMRECA